MTPEEFTPVLRGFHLSAWRLETLQQYGNSGEDERLRRFLAGESYVPTTAKEQWLSTVRDNLAAGRTMGRVHVVTEPLTDYMRYELTWGYGPNVEAGEDVRLIPIPADDGQWPTGLRPGDDFWLFDSQDLYVMRYADDGTWLSVEPETDPAAVVIANHQRDLALHYAIPYREYMRRHPNLLSQVAA